MFCIFFLPRSAKNQHIKSSREEWPVRGRGVATGFRLGNVEPQKYSVGGRWRSDSPRVLTPLLEVSLRERSLGWRPGRSGTDWPRIRPYCGTVGGKRPDARGHARLLTHSSSGVREGRSSEIGGGGGASSSCVVCNRALRRRCDCEVT